MNTSQTHNSTCVCCYRRCKMQTYPKAIFSEKGILNCVTEAEKMQSILKLGCICWWTSKFRVWNTLSFQPNSNMKWTLVCTKMFSVILSNQIFKAVLRKMFLLCRLFCWTCFSWSFRHCLSGINRLNHCWDSWWRQKRERERKHMKYSAYFQQKAT